MNGNKYAGLTTWNEPRGRFIRKARRSINQIARNIRRTDARGAAFMFDNYPTTFAAFVRSHAACGGKMPADAPEYAKRIHAAAKCKEA